MSVFEFACPPETRAALERLQAARPGSTLAEAARAAIHAQDGSEAPCLRPAARPRPPGLYTPKARAAALSNDDIRALPLELRASFVRWRQHGLPPEPDELEQAYAAAGPELRLRLQAAFSL
jgi:hypothetical protein